MRILIAGLGAIGQRHARNLRTICGDDLELLAYRRRGLRHVVTDRLAKDDSLDVEAALGIRAFARLDDALALQPDAVFICTPSSQHLELALRSVRAGAHLFIEKPLSHSLDGVRELAHEVRKRGRVVLVASQWRFHPCVRALRELVLSGALGRLHEATFDSAEFLPDWHPYEDYRMSYAAREVLGGGVVLTQIHDYDLACWLFGAPATVRASGGRLSTLEIDVEDTVDAVLEGGTCPVRVRQTFAERAARRVITVRGDAATATADLLAARVALEPPLAPMQFFPDYQRNSMFLDEVVHFMHCLTLNAESAVPLSDGVLALRTALAVKRSLQTGHVVDLG